MSGLLGGSQASRAQADRPATHAQRILNILADGRWHSSAELHRRVYCILHSRIAELRRRGFVIEHRGGGGGAENHEYKLLSAPDARQGAVGSSRSEQPVLPASGALSSEAA